MNSSEIHFCSSCYNLTRFYLNEDQKLIYHCKACDKTEEFQEETACIHSITFEEIDISEIINENKYITHDITLPVIEGNSNIQCTNPECESIKGDKPSSLKYIKYDSENMKYIYICNYCGQKWKNT